jgi:hypothetical protein
VTAARLFLFWLRLRDLNALLPQPRRLRRRVAPSPPQPICSSTKRSSVSGDLFAFPPTPKAPARLAEARVEPVSRAKAFWRPLSIAAEIPCQLGSQMCFVLGTERRASCVGSKRDNLHDANQLPSRSRAPHVRAQKLRSCSGSPMDNSRRQSPRFVAAPLAASAVHKLARQNSPMRAVAVQPQRASDMIRSRGPV